MDPSGRQILPTELWAAIIVDLAYTDLVRLASTCKTLHAVLYARCSGIRAHYKTLIAKEASPPSKGTNAIDQALELVIRKKIPLGLIKAIEACDEPSNRRADQDA